MINMAKTCTTCQKQNSQDALVCAFCGTPLMGLLPSRTTEPVTDVPLKIKPPEHIIQLTKLYSDIVVLAVLGQEQPILVKGGGKIVLGRYSPGDVAPSVDLTPYNANLLGVSRQHATITRSENGYVIEDIGSTNGTWLNEVKITPNKPHPLQSGDLIRLGQLGLYVYYETKLAIDNAEIELILKKQISEVNRFTTKDLSALVIPYLTAIDEIQKICHLLAERQQQDISIVSLNYDSETNQLKIKLTGADASYRLLKTKIIPWKEKYLKEVNPVAVASTLATEANPTTSPQTSMNGDITAQQNRSNDEERFARNLVNELAPNRPEADKIEFVEKLTPHIRSLATNPLQFITNE